jgi:hypothetical protein
MVTFLDRWGVFRPGYARIEWESPVSFSIEIDTDGTASVSFFDMDFDDDAIELWADYDLSSPQRVYIGNVLTGSPLDHPPMVVLAMLACFDEQVAKWMQDVL